MRGGVFRSRIALGWGKSLLVERDTFYIRITQQISKGTYDYIKSIKNEFEREKAFIDAPNIPAIKIIGVFDSVTKNAIKRYYGTFETGRLDEIRSVNRTNQLANSYKSIISNFNKEHKNETNNKKV